MKNLFSILCFVPMMLISCTGGSYSGKPWAGQPQAIPGRVQCELYDTGGEGVSYHDTDSVNNGSGKLNPVNGSFLNEFRMNEGVDISYTKSNGTDDNPFSDVMPEMNQLYVGWTVPDEWIKYTVDVKEAGVYKIDLMYTGNGDGTIELITENGHSAGAMHVVSTHKDADTLAWRQWHHWNKTDSLGSLPLTRGIQVLTLRTIDNGNMNYDYLEFIRMD